MSSDSPSQSPVRLGLLAVLAVAVLGAGVWAVLNERGNDVVAASIDDFEITVDEVNELLRTNPGNVSPEGVVGTELGFANLLVTNTVLIEAVATDLVAAGTDPATFEDEAFLSLSSQPGFDPGSAFAEWQIRFDSVLLALEAQSRSEALATIDPSAAPEFLCSSHILLETEAAAIEVREALDGGADFATLAAERSIGPSGPRGGDLGCVPPINFVPEFSAAAVANGPGLTDPVQTDFGWHVILVRSVGPLTTENHPELTDEDIVDLLADQTAIDTISQAFIQGSIDRAIAESTVDPRYGTWNPATGQLDLPSGVTPG